VFGICDRAWRGIGVIPRSGLTLNPEFQALDAALRFDSFHIRTEEPRSRDRLRARSNCPVYFSGTV
jgi:hydrogenase expression/formation protein HypD